MTYTYLAELAARIEVPVGGTLSRVLYKDDHVRLVAFGFDAGEELTDHTASFPAIVQVLSGKLRVGLAGDTIEQSAGDWLHMPAGLVHSVLALEPSVMLLTILRGGE